MDFRRTERVARVYLRFIRHAKYVREAGSPGTEYAAPAPHLQCNAINGAAGGEWM